MPNFVKRELSKKIIHPRSRKALQLTKQTKKISKREKVKLVHHMKQNLLGEKLLWFRDHLVPDVTVYTPELTINSIDLYLGRFQEEMEQIALKHAVGSRKNRQHASREDIIKLTLLREEEEFTTCGLEIPDLMNPKQLEMLRTWDGELRFLQNFKLKRYNRRTLQSLNTSGTSRTVVTKVPQTAGASRTVGEPVTKVPQTDGEKESDTEVKESEENESVDNTEDAVMDVDT